MRHSNWVAVLVGVCVFAVLLVATVSSWETRIADRILEIAGLGFVLCITSLIVIDG